MKHETSSRLEESGSMGLTETIAGPLSRVHKEGTGTEVDRSTQGWQS